MLFCPKCKDAFRKRERYEKHVIKCPGKICKNCGEIGHLACGISLSGEDMKQKIQDALAQGKKVKIVGLF